MKFDKSPHWLVALFKALQPEVGGEPRQMFGYPCGFVDGQMFAGLFGDGLFVRLDEPDRLALLALPGALPFAPMGRPSKHYLVLPPSMLEDEEEVKRWMSRALAFARTLPKKEPKARRAAGAKSAGAKSAGAKSAAVESPRSRPAPVKKRR